MKFKITTSGFQTQSDKSLNKYPVNFKLIIIVAVVVAALSGIASYRIKIDTDIIGTLPQNDPVISDSRSVLLHHPIHDQLVIDVSLQSDDTEVLVEGAALIEKKLQESLLFKSIGMKEMRGLFPELIFHIADSLPLLFSERQLQDEIKPLLEPEQVRKKLEISLSQLQNIDGIGQAELLSKDPLGLRNFALVRLSHLAPSKKASIFKGQLVSLDGRHLLIIAKPKYSGSDTTFARMAAKVIEDASTEVNRKYASEGYIFTLTPAGAYRAALDNEEAAKRDIEYSLLWSTIIIGILLFFAFPRPWIGLLSFIPSIAGTIVAFFVFSLFNSSISIVTLGFGGAIIAITVDQGIAYLLFLDQKHETRGKKAAEEVWDIELLATLTTILAFLMLCISGFPILSEIGLFVTLGGIFSFLFVHTIFPKIFPVMPPAKSQRPLIIHELVNRFALAGGKKMIYAAIGFTLVMLYFAKPDFRVDLASMNTVTKETKSAEQLLSSVWGNILSRIYLIIEGNSMDELRKKGDKISAMLEQELHSGSLSSAFVSSMVLPGDDHGKQNFSAWKEFWTIERKASLKNVIDEASSDLGFASDAFEPFFKMLNQTEYVPVTIPEKFFELLGISRSPDQSKWIQFCAMTSDKLYNAENFYKKFSGLAKVFDPKYFSVRLGNLLSATFIRMVIIVTVSTIILLFFVFFDLKLMGLVLIPPVFAFISTLGTLKLMGHPVDIPGIMLSIVILGMGVDYAIYFVHSYRKYKDEHHPSFALIRTSVFLTGLSAMAGFAVLCFAEHILLRSAGLISMLGIGYSLIGTFMILPPAMKSVIK